MEAVETGKDKVKKICEVLRKETLEPALQEAEGIVGEANGKAEAILEQAKAKAQMMIQEAERTLKKGRGFSKPP